MCLGPPLKRGGEPLLKQKQELHEAFVATIKAQDLC